MTDLTTHKTLEWREYEKDQTDKISKKTLDTYKNDYKRFRNEMANKRNIYNLPQREIKSIVENAEGVNANGVKFQKLALLNIAIVLLKWKLKPTEILIKYRTELQDGKNAVQTDKNKLIIENSGVDYHDLIGALDTSSGKDYLLFYLLINHNTRNKDLIIKVISNKQKELLNEEDNFIVVSPSKATFIRNDYKTANTFGTKKDVIRDEKFVKFIKNELDIGNEVLFTNNKRQPYKPADYSKFISARFKKYLPDATKLTQAVIYKIITSHAHSNKDIKLMKKIADRRGHSLETQMLHYATIDFNDKKAEEDSDSE